MAEEVEAVVDVDHAGLLGGEPQAERARTSETCSRRASARWAGLLARTRLSEIRARSRSIDAT